MKRNHHFPRRALSLLLAVVLCMGLIPSAFAAQENGYGYGKNVYWLYDCAAEFTERLPESVTYEYTDSAYHTKTTAGGSYCCFCYGTNRQTSSTLERHTLETDILPQPANGRFWPAGRLRTFWTIRIL